MPCFHLRFESEGAPAEPNGFDDLPSASAAEVDGLHEPPDEDPEVEGLDVSDEEEAKYHAEDIN